MGVLDDVKVGDTLAEFRSVGWSGREILAHTVTAIHKLHVVTGEGSTQYKWKKSDGKRVGAGLVFTHWAVPWTKEHDKAKREIADELIQRRRKNFLQGLNWNGVAPEVVAKAFAVVKAGRVAGTEEIQ